MDESAVPDESPPVAALTDKVVDPADLLTYLKSNLGLDVAGNEVLD